MKSLGGCGIGSVKQGAQYPIVRRQHTAARHDLGVLLRYCRKQGGPWGIRRDHFRIRLPYQTLDNGRQHRCIRRREKILVSSVAQSNDILLPGLKILDGQADFWDEVRHAVNPYNERRTMSGSFGTPVTERDAILRLN